jgi:hypothetical protein
LWIKRVFGVCGELWWVSCCSRFYFGLSGWIFGICPTIEIEGGWEKRGQNVVSWVVIADSSLVVVVRCGGFEFPCLDPVDPFKGVKKIC